MSQSFHSWRGNNSLYIITKNRERERERERGRERERRKDAKYQQDVSAWNFGEESFVTDLVMPVCICEFFSHVKLLLL